MHTFKLQLLGSLGLVKRKDEPSTRSRRPYGQKSGSVESLEGTTIHGDSEGNQSHRLGLEAGTRLRERVKRTRYPVDRGGVQPVGYTEPPNSGLSYRLPRSGESYGTPGRRLDDQPFLPQPAVQRLYSHHSSRPVGRLTPPDAGLGLAGALTSPDARRTSENSVVDDQIVSKRRSKDGYRVRDTAAGALARGILTAAALKHHESKDKERRRKRRSKSQSASIAESEEIFEKHDIPPMPMRSDIDTELTRDSILQPLRRPGSREGVAEEVNRPVEPFGGRTQRDRSASPPSDWSDKPHHSDLRRSRFVGHQREASHEVDIGPIQGPMGGHTNQDHWPYIPPLPRGPPRLQSDHRMSSILEEDEAGPGTIHPTRKQVHRGAPPPGLSGPERFVSGAENVEEEIIDRPSGYATESRRQHSSVPTTLRNNSLATGLAGAAGWNSFSLEAHAVSKPPHSAPNGSAPTARIVQEAPTDSKDQAEPRIEEQSFDLHQVYKSEADIPYKHLKYLGKGSFGFVDKVEHKLSSSKWKRYARKTIQYSNWDAAQDLEAIENEASIIKRLSHRHMARLVCTYQFERQFCFIMLPVADSDLGEFLFNLDTTKNGDEREQGLTWIWRWYGCLAQALDYLHKENVRHKDIKPANILVKGKNIYITDFGIAKNLVGEETTASIGTPGARSPMYCAPEVYNEGHRRGRKADVFSLGCVFLEMTTVLFGASLHRFKSFRRQKDTNKRAYAANLDKVLQWLVYLALREEISGALPGVAQGSYALYWAFRMLDPQPDSRPSSQELTQGMQARYFLHAYVVTGCLSCLPVRNPTSLLPEPLMWQSLLPVHEELVSVEEVLGNNFQVTWEQARANCLPQEVWLRIPKKASHTEKSLQESFTSFFPNVSRWEETAASSFGAHSVDRWNDAPNADDKLLTQGIPSSPPQNPARPKTTTSSVAANHTDLRRDEIRPDSPSLLHNALNSLVGSGRLQSKDIVALMDHLNLRDKQRNARDTEILVTLVRSAAEMRNTFEDMEKKFLAEQKNGPGGAGNSNLPLRGPRPQPMGLPRVSSASPTELPALDREDVDDLSTRRRNVFKPALRGLSSNSSRDLVKVEEMLDMLLGEVEDLKAEHAGSNNGGVNPSVDWKFSSRDLPENDEATLKILDMPSDKLPSNGAPYGPIPTFTIDGYGGFRRDAQGSLIPYHPDSSLEDYGSKPYTNEVAAWSPPPPPVPPLPLSPIVSVMDFVDRVDPKEDEIRLDSPTRRPRTPSPLSRRSAGKTNRPGRNSIELTWNEAYGDSRPVLRNPSGPPPPPRTPTEIMGERHDREKGGQEMREIVAPPPRIFTPVEIMRRRRERERRRQEEEQQREKDQREKRRREEEHQREKNGGEERERVMEMREGLGALKTVRTPADVMRERAEIREVETRRIAMLVVPPMGVPSPANIMEQRAEWEWSRV